jgi:hypothetical protein
MARLSGPADTRKSQKGSTMMTKLFPIAAAVATGLSGPAAAAGCAPRDVVVDRLAQRYGETRHAVGLGASGTMMEMFAAPETGTWTITVTFARGITCLVASGRAFETLAEPLPEAGEGA